MKKLVKIIGIVIGVIALLGIMGVIVFIINLPEKSDFTHLQEPRIVEKPDMKAMMVNFNGDPNKVIGEAFGSLYEEYYQSAGISGFFKQKPPIARYEFFEELLKQVEAGDLKSVNWKGFVAVPLSGDVEALSHSRNKEYPVRIETLKYGTVAEIIHFGPYEAEKPVIQKLLTFIQDSGFKVAGLHEEEYIRGPGMPFTGPEDYITVIRYQVSK